MASNLDQLKSLTSRLTTLETEYEGFFQVAPDLFAVLTWHPGQLRKEMTFSRVNKAWETILGWTAEEMTTKPYFDLIHPDDRGDDDPDEPIMDLTDWDDPVVVAQLKEAEKRAKAAGIVWKFDPKAEVQLSSYIQRWRAKDGSYRFISWRANFNLQERQAYSVGRDVTESITGSETLHIKRHILRNVSQDYLSDAIRDLTLSKERLEEVIKIMDKEIENSKVQGFDRTILETNDERDDRQDTRDEGQNERDEGQNEREEHQNARKAVQDKREVAQNERDNE